MERSLFYIYYGRQSNQEEKCQCEDQVHRDPKRMPHVITLINKIYYFVMYLLCRSSTLIDTVFQHKVLLS